MKIRQDFVTNSSSSSFLICKKILSDDQIDAIRNHAALAERMGLYCYDEPWNINENDLFITGYTWMDNFSMHEFFEKIGIRPADATWSEYPLSLPGEVSHNEEPMQNNGEKTWQDCLNDIRNGVPFNKEDNELDDLINSLEE